ncbi:rCG62941 [Rattus norvegicus]|uniref:RCG62941 n=1 Tax=Rattus norvegicus TaxID=10116 RepID=A6JN82_RAT|nr:rCG62941 [Rattus norvegicus]
MVTWCIFLSGFKILPRVNLGGDKLIQTKRIHQPTAKISDASKGSVCPKLVRLRSSNCQFADPGNRIENSNDKSLEAVSDKTPTACPGPLHRTLSLCRAETAPESELEAQWIEVLAELVAMLTPSVQHSGAALMDPSALSLLSLPYRSSSVVRYYGGLIENGPHRLIYLNSFVKR